jgi:hypothetical protein
VKQNLGPKLTSIPVLQEKNGSREKGSSMKPFIALALTLALVGCTTLVQIESNPPGANVRLEGKDLGKTPLSVELSDAVWENYNVIFKMAGYRELRVKLAKEIKAGALIGGLFFAIPLLWCYGPDENQYFDLQKE